MKTIFTIVCLTIFPCALSAQSTLAEFLALFPMAELPYTTLEETPTFNPDYDDDKPVGFTDIPLSLEVVKKYIDEYAEGTFDTYPVHQLDLGKYIGLVTFSPTSSRMDGTEMPFYYLNLITKDGKPMQAVMELRTSYHRMAGNMEDLEFSNIESKIYHDDYSVDDIIIETTSSFSTKRSAQYGEDKMEKSNRYYRLAPQGIWEDVTVIIR